MNKLQTLITEPSDMPAMMFFVWIVASCLVVSFLTSLTTERVTTQRMEQEAIAHGAGQYVVVDGGVEFRWKGKRDEPTHSTQTD